MVVVGEALLADHERLVVGVSQRVGADERGCLLCCCWSSVGWSVGLSLSWWSGIGCMWVKLQQCLGTLLLVLITVILYTHHAELKVQHEDSYTASYCKV